ncbi:MAG: SOS mutagenesis and repair protein UmuC [Muribaculaceae bacterium]|nr:SOS mutagenesis and repair protein UmuC [Muribaculaceae bacterium]
MMTYGLVDCNNFFVSCERLFNPDLNGKAVVVLSNNDGCVIARSNEAKALGIPMSCPAFQIREHTREPVVVLSGRHTVYGDLSRRVMAIMGAEVENLEVYSVDEAFFTLPFDDVECNHVFLAGLVRKIMKWVGLPVSIGFAPTRTLAKIASHIAKKDRRITDSVYWLMRPEAIDIILRRTPVGDVWGIGRRLREALNNRGVITAAQFVDMPSSLVRTLFSVTTERTQRELRGEDCVAPSPVTMAHNSIMNSRTFGHLITKRREVQDAVVVFAKMCAKRLRDEQAVAGTVTVYVRGDRFRQDVPFYANSCQVRLLTPSASTMTIVSQAMMAFDTIYRDGFGYRKAGVLLGDITSDSAVQLNLFERQDQGRQRLLMQAIDNINSHYGAQVVTLAPDNPDGEWRPEHNHKQQGSRTMRIYTGMQRVREEDGIKVALEP